MRSFQRDMRVGLLTRLRFLIKLEELPTQVEKRLQCPATNEAPERCAHFPALEDPPANR